MRLIDIAIALLVAAIWGLSVVEIDIALNDFPPLFLSCLRFTLAAIPAIFFVRFPVEVGWRNVVWIGMILGVIKFSLIFIAIDIGTHAGVVAFALQSQVFFTISIAVVLLNEKLTLRQLIGFVMALVSGCMLVFSGAAIGNNLGFAMIILAGLAWAVANIIIKTLGRVQIFQLFVWVSLVPIVPMLLMSLAIEGPQRAWETLSSITLLGVVCLLYLAFASTLFCYAGWGYLLGKYPTNKVTPFALLIPMFGLLGSHVILSEPIGLFKLTALALMLLALSLCIFTPGPRRI